MRLLKIFPLRASAPLRLCVNVFAFTLLMAGCDALPGAGSANSPGSQSIIPQVAQEPADVVEQFLNAWESRDYQTMYSMLATESQGSYTLPVFQTTYENVDQSIQLSGLDVTLHDTEVQGITAAVHYDLTIHSPAFGEIEDDGRIMRLVNHGNGWRVAWSSMDIFDGLAAGARVEVDAEAPPRGNIYDRSGNPLVEEDGTVLEIYLQKQNISDEATCYNVLGTALRRDYHEIEAAAANYNPETIFYVGDMDAEEFQTRADTLREWCGITGENGLVQERTDRRYIGHGAAAHVTGYIGQATDEDIQAGFQPGDMIGQIGVEAAYDEQLRGQATRVLRITEPGGTIIRDLGGAEGSASQSVWLTIDRDLQLAAAQALYDAYTYAEPSWGTLSPGAGVAIVDVDSGAILALASYPTFDPGLFSPDTPFPFPGAYIAELLSDPEGAFFNRGVQGQYAPGSTFKIITTAAAANERLMRPDELFYCDLQWDNGPRYGDTLEVRLDWRASEPFEEDRFPTGDVTMSQALTSSCDPFFYEMGARLFQRDPNLLSNYARRMGLGREYGLEPIFPEAAGNIPATRSVEEAINEAIGQGDVQVTPLQMATVVAGVANNGTLYRPYIVQRVGAEGETPSFEASPQTMSDMELSQEAINIVRQGMCDVTRTDARNTTNGAALGTAWFVFENSYYSICAKTGTAQTGRPEPNSWFVAYVPAENPQIAIAVLSQNSREGSEVAAPIMRRILDDYLNVPPENFAAFPDWWTEEYHPLSIAEGGTGGG